MEKLVKTKYVCAFGRFAATRVAGAAAVTRLLSVVVLLLALPSSAWAQLVTRVVDGDTIIVTGVGTVRLIGVDTPETVDPRTPVQFFGKEASEFTRRMAQGKVVRLEFDTDRTDKYQRTLSYVYLPDGTFLNAEIVKQGYGHAYVKYPFTYLDQFRAYEREAREARRGFWGDAAVISAVSDAGDTAKPEQVVYLTRTGTKYHREGCRFLARSQIAVALKDVGSHEPCGVCKPPTLRDATTATTALSAPPKSAPTPPASTPRCQATTKKGTQCSRSAKAGTSYCWQHAR